MSLRPDKMASRAGLGRSLKIPDLQHRKPNTNILLFRDLNAKKLFFVLRSRRGRRAFRHRWARRRCHGGEAGGDRKRHSRLPLSHVAILSPEGDAQLAYHLGLQSGRGELQAAVPDPPSFDQLLHHRLVSHCLSSWHFLKRALDHCRVLKFVVAISLQHKSSLNYCDFRSLKEIAWFASTCSFVVKIFFRSYQYR